MFIVEAFYGEWEAAGEFSSRGRATNFGRKELINIDWRIVDSTTGEILQTFSADESRYYIEINPVRQAHRDRLTEKANFITQSRIEEQRRIAEIERGEREVKRLLLLDQERVDKIFARNLLGELDYDWMKEGF